jgi:hypothetical protein
MKFYDITKILEKDKYEPIYTDYYNFEMGEFGFSYVNKCHSKIGDKCKCIFPKRKDIEGKMCEACRWCNYRNLNLSNDRESKYRCICGEPITYVYQIRHIETGVMIPELRDGQGIGSVCMKKLGIDYDIYKAKTSLEKYGILFPHRVCPLCKEKNFRKTTVITDRISCTKCPPTCAFDSCPRKAVLNGLCKQCHPKLKVKSLE